MSHRSSSCFVGFCQILNELCPFVGLGILHIGSFPHFLSTCFEVLSWNFVYVFVMMSHRSSLSFMWFHQILNELCPFFDFEYYTYCRLDNFRVGKISRFRCRHTYSRRIEFASVYGQYFRKYPEISAYLRKVRLRILVSKPIQDLFCGKNS